MGEEQLRPRLRLIDNKTEAQWMMVADVSSQLARFWVPTESSRDERQVTPTPSFYSLIERVRQEKRLTITDLVARTGLSAATYHRMRRDQANIKLTDLIKLMDALHLQVSDVEAVVEAQFMVNAQWQAKIEETVKAVVRHEVPSAALAQLRRELDRLVDADARRLLIGYLTLMQAKLAADPVAAKKAATTLWRQLMALSLWHHFEYQLVFPTLSYLDWAQLQQTYAEHFAHADWRLFGPLLNAGYLAILANVLRTREPVAIATVLAWFEVRRLPVNNLEFRLYQRFGATVKMWLAGATSRARASFEELMTTLTVLYGQAGGAPAQILARLWILVQAVKPSAVTLCAVAPAAVSTAADLSLVAWLNRLRTGKCKSAAAFWHALYLSKAAYYRQFAADHKLKTNEFLTALNFLRVDLRDIQHRERLLGLTIAATQHALFCDVAKRAVDQSPMRTLADWTHRLAGRGESGYAELALWLTVIVAEDQGRDTVAATNALRLYRQLVDYERWTAFEYALILPILPYIPFEQGRVLFSRLVVHKSGQVALAVADPADLDLIFIGLLGSAIRAGQPVFVRQALSWITQRQVTAPALAFRCYQRIAEKLLADPAADLTAERLALQQVGVEAPLIAGLNVLIQQIRRLLTANDIQPLPLPVNWTMLMTRLQMGSRLMAPAVNIGYQEKIS